ncbi:MAG: M20/M25/M40 family metallo-hydrolase [Clostridia bacterium]|nr:M20/M25/M40 family metallo-hydrolase [Clostridia bacterium]
MDTERLFELIESKKEEYLNFLKEIAEIESPTTYKEGVDAVGEYFIEKAKAHGWKTEVFRQEKSGNVVVITMNPESKEKPFCLSGHLDTVHPLGLFGNPCVKIEGNKMIGPGACDCKGGCVNAFWAMDALAEMGYNKRPVMLLLQSDEETSSRESNKETIKYIVERSKDAVAFFNMEPSILDTGVVLERKGIAKFEFTVSGISEHASKCYDGASAIAEAANKILKLEKYKDRDGITCNCGTIKGGTVPNTVPEKCVFSLDTRFANEQQYKEICELVNRVSEESVIQKTSCEVKEIGYRPSMPKSEKNYALLKSANEILKNADLKELKAIIAFGGSDAAYVTLADIPVIDSVGVIGDNVHSQNEYILTDSFSLPTKRAAAIIANI